MEELTKEMFDILKTLCANRVFTVLVPDVLESDSEQIHANHANHIKTFTTLIAHGFAKEITSEFEATIKEIKAEQEKLIASGSHEQALIRGFTAFVLTEQAVSMFSAPEGLVN